MTADLIAALDRIYDAVNNGVRETADGLVPKEKVLGLIRAERRALAVTVPRQRGEVKEQNHV